MNDSEQTGSNLEFDKIHDALEKSTARNSRQLLSFVLIQLYLLITVAATTDLMLLLPDSKVTLPLLNVDLPLFGFYIVAPALIVIFHFHYLINLLQHARKLKAWDEAKSYQQNVLLPGFIFNFSILFKKITVNYRLLRFLQAAILCFFPLLLLLFIQIRFADYHSVPMTSWHFALVVVDFIVLLIYWYRINYPELLHEKYDAFKILLTVFTFKWKQKDKDLQRPKTIVSRAYLWLFAMVQLVSLSCLLVVVMLSFNYFEERYFFIPYISVPSATLVEPPSDLIIQAYLMRGKSLDSAWLEHGQGIDLRGRDFQFANLSGADLRKVSLASANLNYSFLDSAILTNANLINVQLSRASLRAVQLNNTIADSAQFNNSVFEGANLNDARLLYAQLNAANLADVKLDGVKFSHAQFNNASLRLAQLNGVDLSSAQLNGADLSYAQLNGADLSSAQLNGADLGGAQLNGADLGGAQLNGADLGGAQLNGANLWEAQLNGANLWGTQLCGASLAHAQLNGVYFENAKVRACLYFETTEIYGLFYENIDKVTIPDWDSLITAFESMTFSKPLLQESALRRLRNAQEYQEYLDFMASTRIELKQDADYTDSDLRRSKRDPVYFIKARQELSCQRTYIAKGMLMQFFSTDSLRVLIGSNILHHMQQKCPDTLLAIQSPILELIHDEIDSILQGSK